MGAYQFLNGTTSDVTGILRTADGQRIPVNEELGAWNEYLEWKAVPNTPDPATAIALAGYRKAAKLAVDVNAHVEFAKDLRLQSPGAPTLALAYGKLIMEAVEIDVDAVAFNAGRHPMVNELIGTEGATGPLVATAIRTWWDTVKVRVGQTLKEAWKGHKDINAAGTTTAVDAVAPTWPGGGAGE